MDRRDELVDFIKRAHELTRPIIAEYEDPDVRRQREWFKTKKGKEASKRGSDLRRERMKEAIRETSWEEKRLVREFYFNRPEGFEVDHIVPVSRGGRHILSNLRYVTHEENAKKWNKLIEELEN